MTYRADDVVSGSSTPTIPLPWDARPVSSFISAKSGVNFVASTWGTDPEAVPADPELEDELDDPQAAAVASSANTATRTTAVERALRFAGARWVDLTASS